jgi:hypothetical protein
MSFKPSHEDWMAYLYNECEDGLKEKIEAYLKNNVEAQQEFAQLKKMRSVLSSVKDKEVIAPSIVIAESSKASIWHVPYWKTVASIAASLLIVMLCAKFLGLRLEINQQAISLRFGTEKDLPVVEHTKADSQDQSTLTSAEVQDMINAALAQNNQTMEVSWQQTQRKLDASLRENLANTSSKIDQLVRESSLASQAQIQDFVATMQAENMQTVKSYFQLSSAEQKSYVEGLLVDFAKYLQQQRQDDLQLVQTRINSMQKNTDVFKQETEQILTSLIYKVGTPTTEAKY